MNDKMRSVEVGAFLIGNKTYLPEPGVDVVWPGPTRNVPIDWMGKLCMIIHDSSLR